MTFSGLLERTGAQGIEQWGLVLLICTVAVLFAGTLVLSGYALIVRAKHQASATRSERLTERWRDPVLTAVGDPSAIPSVRALVGEEDEIHFLGFAIEYARRVRGEERAVLRELVQPFLPVMEERTRSRTVGVRAWAVQSLGTLGLPEYEKEVLAGLDDPSPLVAMVAARALSREETPQYASSVLARLERFTNWNPHFLAAMLAAIGPSILEELRSGLADETRDPAARVVLSEALRLQGDFLAADVAVTVLQASEDRNLKLAAFRLLATVGRPEHAPMVRPYCTSTDPVLRAQALRALGTVGGREDLPVLLQAMDDTQAWPALYAARGVRNAGGRTALRELVSSGKDQRSALAEQVLAEEGEV